jgi:uncharacterized protein
MKPASLLFFLILFFCGQTYAQRDPINKDKPHYDSLLAKRVGADEYGMKKYVMAFLKSGYVKIQDSVERADLQRMHLRNIMRLAAEGTLIIAGPFLDDQAIRGIFIFNVESVEEARAIAETDPAVKAGTLTLELHPWYGSAALVETAHIHKRIEKKSVAD